MRAWRRYCGLATYRCLITFLPQNPWVLKRFDYEMILMASNHVSRSGKWRGFRSA